MTNDGDIIISAHCDRLFNGSENVRGRSIKPSEMRRHHKGAGTHSRCSDEKPSCTLIWEGKPGKNCESKFVILIFTSVSTGMLAAISCEYFHGRRKRGGYNDLGSVP